MTDSDDGPSFYRYLKFNAPLSGKRADAIAGRLAAGRPREVIDIGCGWGELLLRVVARAPGARGLGADTDERALRRAEAAARTRGLQERVSFACVPGDQVRGPADVVLCVGASHALGDGGSFLPRLRELIRPGGRLLLGEGTWDPHAPYDRDLVWDDLPALADLAGLVDRAMAAGLRPLHIETSSQDELDAFESGYLADYEEWLLTHPAHPDAEQIRAKADDHRNRWLHGYRAGFGFAYLTLGRPV